MKLLEKVAVEVGLNSKVCHLEGETIFGSAKWKLDLLPRDNSDSHRHNRVNYSIPMVGKGVSLGQARTVCAHSGSSIRSSILLSYSQESTKANNPQSYHSRFHALTSYGLPMLKSTCLDPIQWRIERISFDASDLYRGHFEGQRRNAKIARYGQAMVVPIFTGIEKHSKSSES